MNSRLTMLIIASAFASAPFAFGGTDRSANSSIGISEEPPRFDFAIESAYIFGAFNPPYNYEISGDCLTTRVRCGNYLHCGGLFHCFYLVYLLFFYAHT